MGTWAMSVNCDEIKMKCRTVQTLEEAEWTLSHPWQNYGEKQMNDLFGMPQMQKITNKV
jgi:hypothetical protein